MRRAAGPLLLAFFASLVTLILLEVVARAYIKLRWPRERAYMLTHHDATRGRFTSDSAFGFVLTRGFRDASGRFTHNDAGFRGAPFVLEKTPGALRVALVGASTVYGIYVPNHETSSAYLERRLREFLPNVAVEVINGGVPGWTSTQSVESVRRRILPRRPDVIVVVDGRNDAFPQLFNNYRDDYSHYWNRDFDLRTSNYGYKRLFRVSNLAMLLITGGGGHLGFSHRAEHPAYGAIRYENRPDATQLIQNAADARRAEAFRGYLKTMVAEASRQGVMVVLVTIPFMSERFASGVIPRDSTTLPAIAQVVARNQQITREVANEAGVPLVEAAKLARPELLVDDCHFNRVGEKAFADLIFAAIRPSISNRQPSAVSVTRAPRVGRIGL